MKKMDNDLEEMELYYQPNEEFTLKGSNSPFSDFQVYKENNILGLTDSKNIALNNQNNNIQNFEENQKYNFNFSNLSESLEKNYSSKKNKKRDVIKGKSNIYKKIKGIQRQNNNKNKPNNIYIFPTTNDYWEKREKENAIKMEKIKKERYEKKYGELYSKPKINKNKNTEEIMNRIKENINNKILEEEQIEDQINNNIPIKTEQCSTYFKNDYQIPKNNKNYKTVKNKTITNRNKINKNNNKFDSKDRYIGLVKLKINSKRASPKPKNLNSLTRRKIPYNYKNESNILNKNSIKLLEKIFQFRKEQEKERISKIKSNSKKENRENKTQIINKIIKEVNQNMINSNKNINIIQSKGISIDSLNKNIKILSERIKEKENAFMSQKSQSSNNQSIKLNTNNTDNFKKENELNVIMRKRKQLNDIYNSDKRVINHSYIQSSSHIRNAISSEKSSNQKEIQKFHITKINNTKSFPKLNKLYNYLYHNNLNNKKKIKNERNVNLFDKNIRKMKYIHYTDEKLFSDYTSSNNSSLKYYNIFKNKCLFNDSRFNTENSNTNNISYNKENYINLNNINDMNSMNYFNNNYYLYNDHSNIIVNRKNDKFKNKNSNNNSKKVAIKDILTDNIFNEIDNESLLKYRKENIRKLKELNRNKLKYEKKYLIINLLNKIEASNNYFNKDENLISRPSNNQNIKYILSNEIQKIENKLDYYNKELNLNKKKKEIILSELYGNNNKNSVKQLDTSADINNINSETINETDSENNLINNFNFQRLRF